MAITLQAEWGFNEGSGTVAADTSGNNRPLTGSGFAATAKNGAGAGTGATWSRTGIGPAASPAITVTCWVNFHTLPGSGVFLGILSSPAANIYLEYTLSGTGVAIDFYAGGQVASTVIPLDTPKFIAITTNGATSNLYEGTTPGNLVLSNTSAGNSTTYNLSAQFWVGANGTDEAAPLAGDWIDDVRVYTGTATLAELQAVMVTAAGAGAASVGNSLFLRLFPPAAPFRTPFRGPTVTPIQLLGDTTAAPAPTTSTPVRRIGRRTW